MENFYNRLKHKLSNPPHKETDWDLWTEIEQEMDKSKGKGRLIPLWFWFPFSLLSVGGLMYFVGSKQSRSTLSLQEKQIDTVYISETINHTDTLYIEKEVVKWAYTNSPTNGQTRILEAENALIQEKLLQLTSDLNQFKEAIALGPQFTSKSWQGLPGMSTYLEGRAIENRETEEEHGIIRSPFRSLEGLQSLTQNRVHLDKRPDPILKIDQSILSLIDRNNASLLDQLVPDYFNLGLSIPNPMLTLNQELEFGYDRGAGLFIEALFSSKFSIRSGIQIRSNSTKISDIDRAMTYPQPVGITSEEVFEKLNIISSYTDIPLALKWKLNRSEKWTTYISGGGILSKMGGREYKYEYKRNGNEIYYEVKQKSSDWHFSSVTLGLGMDYSLSENWQLFAEPYIRYNIMIPRTERDRTHGIGLRMGLFYEF